MFEDENYKVNNEQIVKLQRFVDTLKEKMPEYVQQRKLYLINDKWAIIDDLLKKGVLK